MTVQQRLATPQDIGTALLDVRRHARRKFIEKVVLDLIDGAESMGELDFARLCRRHGLPGPRRQAVRRTSRARAYLDAEWPQFGLVVEIDGVHHLAAPAIVDDALRQNDVSLDGATVLRIPLLGLRVAEAEFMSQVRAGLIDGGWGRAA